MKKFSRYCGIAGLALVLLAGLGYALAPMYLGFYVIPGALAAAALLIYLAYNLADLKKFGASRSTRYGAGSALAVVLVLGILIFVGVLTNKHSIRYDVTAQKRYSLAPQTLKILEGLQQEVKAEAFFQEGSTKVQARDLLDQYAHASSKFKYEMVDPDRNPARAQAAGITRYDTLVVQVGDQNEKLNNLNEERLTNALVRLTRPGKKTIYFLTGHGERDLTDIGQDGYSEVQAKLEDQNYQVKPLLLMQEAGMPQDASVLVVAGPKKDPLPAELEAIGKYLHDGGKALFLIDPQTVPQMAEWLTRFNVLVGNNIIVDKMSRLFGADYLMPLVATYTPHPVTANFNMASFFPVARTVSVTEKKEEGVNVVPLAETSDQAWGETNLENMAKGTAEFNQEQDLAGPVPVAVVGTVKVAGAPDEGTPKPEDMDKTKNEGKFIVFGDSDFANNAYLNVQGNSDLFLSSVSWLAEEADLVAVRAKADTSQPLMLTALQAKLLFWLPVVLLPLVVLMIGVLVLTSRRRRQ